ncbi:OmpA family protein [Xenophilus arseniciresistens]|uniref:OmpA family protein n=1 Tax=Xenophilus arseniciresistens TaxID=1283306 RepID=A0AAE3N5X2_9BURK|nr:OmpA family protein [Xenophilus arseniciresistens]MDA7414956.1 OmpA family protein [Xenophilus arseniciresistens]
MSAYSDDDSQQRFALGFLFILIGLLLSTVIGVVVYKTVLAAPDAPQAAAAPAVPATSVAVVTETAVAVVPEGASVQVGQGVVNFYFATGSVDIAPGAAEALALVIQGVEAGRQARISGFHDSTGDRAINEQLAKTRAQTVRDVLIGLAVPAEKIHLEKPSETTGSGNNAQARRVEVRLVD